MLGYNILQQYKIDDKKIIEKNLFRPVIYGISIDNNNTSILDDGISFSKKNNIYILKFCVSDITEFLNSDSDLILKAKKTRSEKENIFLFPLEIKKAFSLNKNKIKLSITIEIQLNEKYKVIDTKVYESAFINKENFSYDKVDRVLLSNPDKNSLIFQLSKLSENLYYQRFKTKKVLDSKAILREIVILANQQMAYYCNEKNIQCIYENQTIKCYKKYSLKQTNYLTFSSPMRKLADLINHYQIKKGLKETSKNTIVYPYTKDKLENLVKDLNKDNCLSDYKYIIRKEVLTAIKEKQKINQDILDKVLIEIKQGRIEIFMIFYIIFSLYTDNSIKEVLIKNLKNNAIKNWELSLFRFLKKRSCLDIEIDYPFNNNVKNSKGFYKTKVQSQKKSRIILHMDKKLFYFHSKKSGSKAFSKNTMVKVLTKIHKYIIQNNLDIFKWLYLYKSQVLILGFFFLFSYSNIIFWNSTWYNNFWMSKKFFLFFYR